MKTEPEFDPRHPLGCHRRRIGDRVVFEHLLDALVHGSGYERIATAACSDRTIRRREEWAAGRGRAHGSTPVALHAYDRIIGLELDDLAVDGCITKAPCGGQGRALPGGPAQGRPETLGGRRGGHGIPLGIVPAGANRHDSPLLRPTFEQAAAQIGCYPQQVTAHLDAGYDSTVTRDLLDELGLRGEIARKGAPAPVQASKRWPIERTHSWMNGYGKLRRCTDRSAAVVEFYLYLAAALRHRASTHPASPQPLSLAPPTDHPPPQVIPIAGRS